MDRTLLAIIFFILGCLFARAGGNAKMNRQRKSLLDQGQKQAETDMNNMLAEAQANGQCLGDVLQVMDEINEEG